MNPAVSVVIAARDYGQYLADALRSVQRQTHTDWECLLIDDGSIDNTVEVIRPFLADRRIRTIRCETLGQSRAKNLGWQLASAPLIAYLDGDDVWLPTKLERQHRLMTAEPKLGVTFSRRFVIDPMGELQASPHSILPRGRVYNEILRDNFICFSSVMVRREVLEHVGGFDDRLELAIDYDLWLRVAKHYPFDFIDEALVKYRTGHVNLSTRLRDRVSSVLSTMRRTLVRRQNEMTTPKKIQRDAWGSTCRTMGFVLRDREPTRAAEWYIQAARHDRRWAASVKAVARSLWTLARSRVGC